MRPFKWTKRHERAASLVADDKLTNEEIAARFGVSRQAVDKWKRRPEFQVRVAEIVAEIRAALVAKGITERQNRIDALNDEHERMRRVIAERAEAEEYQEIAGGTTGLLVKQIKITRDGQIIEEFAVDTGLLRELREHRKVAAQELGQWTEKIAPTDPTGTKEYASDTLDAIRAAEEAYIAALRGKSASVGS